MGSCPVGRSIQSATQEIYGLETIPRLLPRTLQVTTFDLRRIS